MSRRTAAWIAWSLWAFSLALTALSLLLLVLNLSHPDVPIYSFWAENVLFSVGYSTVGAVISPHACREPYWLAFLRDRSPVGSNPFHRRVCHLRATSGAWIAASR